MTARTRIRIHALLGSLPLLVGPLAGCSEDAPGPRIFVFDCGEIRLRDLDGFGLAEEETPTRELFVPCYLVEHPEGRLLWDAGLPVAMAGEGIVEEPSGAKLFYERSLVEQLGDLGLAPADIERVAFSHMHIDHVGAANLFPHATWLIQRAEHEAAFAQPVTLDYVDPALYAKLDPARRVLLDGDHDVFGDGSVTILSAPGHTPGHQVLWVDLRRTGPVLLSGDLYHFRETRALRRVPGFNTDAEATRASMERIERILVEREATLWIEHDRGLADTLGLAPSFHD
ncbi:MAG: N-acyl homoserine lactonase family protein [Myxococcota bacterium]